MAEFMGLQKRETAQGDPEVVAQVVFDKARTHKISFGPDGQLQHSVAAGPVYEEQINDAALQRRKISSIEALKAVPYPENGYTIPLVEKARSTDNVAPSLAPKRSM